jgi:cyanobactin maturation PatA/PatG family protease
MSTNHETASMNQEKAMNTESDKEQPTDGQIAAPTRRAALPSEVERGQVKAVGASTEKTCECGAAGGPSLVFALGTLSIDFGTEARRDSFKQAMGDSSSPEDLQQLLAYLQDHPYEADRLTWVLSVNLTPVYAIMPVGPYAAIAYERLREFLADQLDGKVQRVSIPGTSAGGRRLRSGQKVPNLLPELRGMYSWSTAPLVRSVLGDKAAPEEVERLHGFLERVYDEHRNLGVSSKERALNAATTNAFQVARIFETTVKQQLELDHIEVVPSTIARPGSDCWDVEMIFFAPRQRTERARQVYRFTIDVSDVIPATIGSVRSWAVY